MERASTVRRDLGVIIKLIEFYEHFMIVFIWSQGQPDLPRFRLKLPESQQSQSEMKFSHVNSFYRGSPVSRDYITSSAHTHNNCMVIHDVTHRLILKTNRLVRLRMKTHKNFLALPGQPDSRAVPLYIKISHRAMKLHNIALTRAKESFLLQTRDVDVELS